MSSYCGRRRVCSRLSRHWTIAPQCRKIPLTVALQLLLNTWAKFVGAWWTVPLPSCRFPCPNIFAHVVSRLLPCSPCSLLLKLGLCAPHAEPIIRAKPFVAPLFPTSVHAREKKSHWKRNHSLRWNQDLKLLQVLALHAPVLSSAQAQCFVMQAQAMAAQVQLKTIQKEKRVDFTAWSHCLGAAFYFRHDGLHSAEVIYWVSILLLRNSIRWIHTWRCKMYNSLTAFKNMGWTPPASPLAPCSHFFLEAFILDNEHPGGTQRNKSVTHKEETMNMKQAKCSWFWCIWGSFPWVNTTEILWMASPGNEGLKKVFDKKTDLYAGIYRIFLSWWYWRKAIFSG